MYNTWYLGVKIHISPFCWLGVHKNHEVKTIKKAYPVIKKLVEQLEETNEHVIL